MALRPVDTYDKLRLSMNGTNGSSSFFDSATGKTVSAIGGIVMTTTTYKFGGSCAEFSSGKYLTVPNSSDFSYGTEPFTIDFWIKFTNLSGTQYIYDQAADSQNEVRIFLMSGVLYWQIIQNSNPLITMSIDWTPNVGEWYHVALVRESTATNGTYFFINGVKKLLTVTTGLWNYSIPVISSSICVGARNYNGANSLTAFLGLVRALLVGLIILLLKLMYELSVLFLYLCVIHGSQQRQSRHRFLRISMFTTLVGLLKQARMVVIQYQQILL
jgi:hypothetical protein